jgi:uncharacterized protein YkwD
MSSLLNNLKDHLVPSKGNAYRPHLLTKPWLLFFLTIVFTTEGVLVAGILAHQPIQNYLAAVVPGEVIALTNSQRKENNASPVKENYMLDAAAEAKAQDMATKGYFSHVSPDGSQPWSWITHSGYSYQYAGENLAVRFDNAEGVVEAWMASPTHRSNIVKQVYTDIGIGVAQGTYQGMPATYVVQYFGTPLAQGAAVGSAPTPNPLQTNNSVLRQMLQSFSDNPHKLSLLLAAVATIVTLIIAFAFFIHLEIQSHEMLYGGAVVVAIALLFYALNAHVFATTQSTDGGAECQRFWCVRTTCAHPC